MKINPINNCNFRGIYKDICSENNREKRLEYRRYSWEAANEPLTSFDITDKELPNNESMLGRTEGARRYTTDILGTDIQYSERLCNIERSEKYGIDEKPPMNLEESLVVLEKKLRTFLELKEEQMLDLKKEISDAWPEFHKISQKHYKYAIDIHPSWGRHKYRKSEREIGVIQAFNEVQYLVKSNLEKFELYTELAESQKPVLEKLSWIQTELQRIKDAKTVDRLIDISIPGKIDNEFNPLRLALFVPSSAKGKIVALPHRTITVEEIIKGIKGKLEDKKVFDYVRNLIEKRL